MLYIRTIEVQKSFTQSVKDDLEYTANGLPSTPTVLMKNSKGYQVTIYKNLPEYEGEQIKDAAYIKIKSKPLNKLLVINLIYSEEKEKAENEFIAVINSIEKIDRSASELSQIDISDGELNNELEIQSFLDKHPGPLKTYRARHEYNLDQNRSDTKEISGSFMLADSCLGAETNSISCKVLITLLELKTQAISNPNVDMEAVYNALPVFDEVKSKELYEKLLFLGLFIKEAREEYTSEKSLEIKFNDGSSLSLPSDININEYVLKKILAKLAKNRTAWDRWIGTGDDSFVNVYNKFFPYV